MYNLSHVKMKLIWLTIMFRLYNVHHAKIKEENSGYVNKHTVVIHFILCQDEIELYDFLSGTI